MGDKGFQVPDEDAPPYDYKPAIQDPPHINKTPGSGDNLHIGVFKNSINRLSKTTVALIAGVIAVLIVAGTVVLCVLLTRPSQSSQRAAMATLTKSVTITVGDGFGSETKGLSNTPVMSTQTPGSMSIGSSFSTVTKGTVTLFDTTSTSLGRPSTSISMLIVTEGPSITSTVASGGATNPSGTSASSASTHTSDSSSNSSTSSSTSSTSTNTDTPRCTSGVLYGGTDLIHLNSYYSVYAMEALAAFPDPQFMGDHDLNHWTTPNNTIFLCNGDWNIEALKYCSSGVTSGSNTAACAV